MSLISRLGSPYWNLKKALAVVGLAIKPTARSAVTGVPTISAGTGAPSASEPIGSLWIRTDAADATGALSVANTAAGGWNAALTTGDAAGDAIADAGGYWSTDTIQGAFNSIVTQIAGATCTTYNFLSAYVLADNDYIYPALNKLDLAFGGTLASLTTASKVLVGAINEVDANADTANARIVNRVDPMGVFGTWGIDVDGAETNGGGLVGVTAVLTQAAAAQCKVDNGGVIGNLGAGPLAGYTSNWQLFPDVPLDNDAVYFASLSTIPYCELAIDINVVQASTGGCFTWEYWNGAAWAALTVVDHTSAAATDGSRAFERDGAIHWVPPADWAQATIDGVTTYWVRCRVSTVANIGVALGSTNAKNHEVVRPGDGMLARLTGTIQTIRLNDAAATLHTTADVKFLLMNYTTGLHSGELTFGQDQRTDYWSGLTLACAAGDELGVLVTQEDGANEPANVLLELGYVVT